MNRAITSHRETDFNFPMRRAYYKLLQEILRKKNQDQERFRILEPECQPSEYKIIECRKAAWVEFYINALTAGATLSSLPDVNSCEELATQNVTIP